MPTVSFGDVRRFLNVKCLVVPLKVLHEWFAYDILVGLLRVCSDGLDVGYSRRGVAFDLVRCSDVCTLIETRFAPCRV